MIQIQLKKRKRKRKQKKSNKAPPNPVDDLSTSSDTSSADVIVPNPEN